MFKCSEHRAPSEVSELTSSFCALHVIAGLDPAHGGPSYSVPRLCAALTATDVRPVLYSVAAAGESAAVRWSEGVTHHQFSWDYAGVPVLRNLRYSVGLSRELDQCARAASVIHNHGLWLMPNVMAGRAAASAKKPLVVSPRGMLAPAALAFSKLKKRLFWALLQGVSVRAAACLHATSEQEYGEIRDFGLSNPIAIVPNGIDIPAFSGPLAEKAERVALALGRIHPKKGLEVLVRAWAKLAVDHPDWQLKIIGPSEGGHAEELRNLCRALRVNSITIGQPIYGNEKTATLRQADLFLLPSLNENFGLTVAEALAAGTPAIASKGTPWSGLEAEGCGWWIDHGIDPLVSALDKAMALSRGELDAMGKKGRAWMRRDFSWDRVAVEMFAVYRWLVRGGDRPPCVREK